MPMRSPRPSLPALAARLPRTPRTRFAPSPTGQLHLGHVVNAIYAWGLARALGGEVILRIEDHDRERSRAEYEASILEDLEWLGFDPDLGAIDEFRSGASPFRQRDREPVYARALASLDAAGLLYACDCSRRTIEEAGGTVAGELRYPGTCRSLGRAPAAGLGLRVSLAPGFERLEDALHGPIRQDPSAQCGDMLVRDRIGQWTYQFAVTVDDVEQRIDLVIRGEDLLASTGRQVRLARLLGRAAPPVYLHHPLLFAPTGLKLSKANRDTGVRELRAGGLSAEQVIGMAAAGAGLLHEPTPVAAGDCRGLFERT